MCGIRILASLLLALGLFSCGTVISAQFDDRHLPPKEQTWTTSSGVTFNAVVVDIRADNVTLKRTEDGRETVVPLENLIDTDEAILRVAYFGRQDQRQLEQVSSLIGQIESDSEKALELMSQGHLSILESPYSGLWASVCMNVGKNSVTEASSVLRQVVARIKRQREFDSSRHPMTLTSALNNLAICMLKEYKSDAAAGLLVRALGTMPTPTQAVLHNARQLVQLGGSDTSPLKLNSSTRGKLQNLLSAYSSHQDSLPVGWFYCLNADLPRFERGPKQIAGIAPPTQGRFPMHAATGLAISQNTVLASASMLGMNTRNQTPILTVSTISGDFKLKTYDARVTKIDSAADLVAARSDKAELAPVGSSFPSKLSSNSVAVFSFLTPDGRGDVNLIQSTLAECERARRVVHVPKSLATGPTRWSCC